MSVTPFHELRLAARSLSRRPGYAIVAIATLALGIGASVAMFAVTDSVLLNPLPYPESDRIVTIDHHAPGLNLPALSNSAGTIDFYRGAAKQITRMAAVSNPSVNITGDGPAERIAVERVTPEFFEVVATQPARGRAFTNVDVAQGAPGVAILTDAAWRSRFGADPAIVGRFIELDGQKTEIVGVMPRGFAFPDQGPQALLPLYLDPQLGFGTFGMTGIARLAPGATLQSARAELQALQSRLPERFPEIATPEFLESAKWTATMTTLKERMTRDVAVALWVLLGGVGLLLIIATANVANLFLVRAESRKREMALRTALGAGRARMAATFLSESAVIGAAGGVLGLVLAFAGVRLLTAYGPERLPRLAEVHLNGSVLVFAAAVTVVASAGLGLIPFAATRHTAQARVLREGGRSATAGRDRHRVRQMLTAMQVAMSLVLLVGAQLMLASVQRLRAVDPGFTSDGVLTLSMTLERTASGTAARQFYQQVVEESAALPGALAAGLTNSLPVERRSVSGSSFSIESRPRAENALPPVAYYTTVTPGYFETMRIPLRAGRAPEWRDSDGKPRMIWINETFATRFLGGRGVGERIRFGEDSVWAEIAGVVGDVRQAGLREEIQPMAFYALGAAGNGVENSVGTLVLRTNGDPTTLANALRSIVARANAAVPVVTIRTMDDVISSSLSQTSFTMMLLTIAALVSLALGVVGLYGVISYVVSQRRNEIGVRMALGARPAQIRRMVLRQAAVLAFVGVAVGVGVAAGLTRLMESLLFGISARDPWIFAGSALALMLVSLVASDLPARRAAGVQPLEALQAD